MRMPDDVLAFVGAGGGDSLKDAFDKTLLGEIWNDQGIRTFCRSIKTEVVAKAQQETGDANLAKKVDDVLNHVRLALSRPMVIGVAQVPVEEGPPVAAFAILDAGDRKAEFTAAVIKLEAMIGWDHIVGRQIGSLTLRASDRISPIPLYWGWSGTHFVVAVNDAQGAAVRNLARPRSKPHASLGKVPGGGDTLVIAADVQAVRQMVGSLMLRTSGKQDAEAFVGILQSLGLTAVKGFYARVGFAGPDLSVQALWEMPPSSTGLFSLCKPVDPACLGLVDARAVTADAVNCDLAALYDAILGVVKTASPRDAYPSAQKGIAQFESETKIRIREGLLASLAGPAVLYSLPIGVMPEAPRGGGAAIIKLKDAVLFEKTMIALAALVQSKANGAFQSDEQKRDDGRTVHVWMVPASAMTGTIPTWSIAKDQVVIATSEEVHDLAVQRLEAEDAPANSLPAAEGYRSTVTGLPKNLTRLTYIDSQVRFSQAMTQVQQVWPMLTMTAVQAGIKLPVAVPSLRQVAQGMKPSLRYSYWASDGLHTVYRGPGVELSQMSVSKVALGMGILMPALARTRQLAFRMTSGTNLVGIGRTCHHHAENHGGKLPPDLKTLVTEAGLAAMCLESKLKPKDFAGPSYVYVPGQDLSMDPQNVVAYDNPEFCLEGVNVLFLDGHVVFMKPEPFRQAMEATCRRLNRVVPEIRFQEKAGAQPRRARPVGPGQI